MKIVTVSARFAPENSSTAIKILQTIKEEARSMDNCLCYDFYVDPIEKGLLFINQNWGSAEAFESYRSSDLFKRMIRELKPLMITAPETNVYEVERAA
ncbi:putative quinol monooxygenase [Kiloniella antarctica]|uniref:Quinol monooxygenase n=1 Tax=Kiloniella antarctica TaxID=1550907 RepID=A0ABW5BPF0_9PROT